MSKRYLFDTSVWIDFFSGTDSLETQRLTRYLEEDMPVFICPVIIQEVLQGVKNDRDYLKVKESFLALEILVEEPVEAAVGAADIYRALRKKGITIRKSNDCLIAWYALKNSLEIIHRDRDFDLILENKKYLNV